MSKFDEKKYNQAKDIAAKFFNKNKKIKSACLEDVVLNSDGFMHLIWRNEVKKHKRDWKNQVKRFHLLIYVKPVLQGMQYYQEYSEALESVQVKKRRKLLFETKVVKYWAFIAIIDDRIRIKIILRKIGAGNIHFWSIIPIWKTKEYKNIKIVSLHKGNLKED